MERITLAELEKRGATLCSRCPGSSTPGKGNPHLPSPEDRPEPLPESRAKPGPAEITRYEFVPSPIAPLIAMGPDRKLSYRPFSDKGDKLMDWSYCGYRNSSVPIPMVSVVVTLDPHSNQAVKVGNMAYPQGKDSRAEIQAAIDRVAGLEPNPDGIRGAVLLKRGTHFINGPIIVSSGVVLRGEGDGEDGTVLIMTTAKATQPAVDVRRGDGEDLVREGGGEAVEDRAEVRQVLPAGAVLSTGDEQLGDDLGDLCPAAQRPEDLAIVADDRGERFAVGELAGLHVVLDRGDQGNIQLGEQIDRLHVAVALVGLQVGDVLHAALDSLRNELGLLFGGFKGAEGLAKPFAVAVVGDQKADPVTFDQPIDRHRGAAELHHRNRLALALPIHPWARGLAPLSTGDPLSCHQFVTTPVHDPG